MRREGAAALSRRESSTLRFSENISHTSRAFSALALALALALPRRYDEPFEERLHPPRAVLEEQDERRELAAHDWQARDTPPPENVLRENPPLPRGCSIPPPIPSLR